MPVPRLSPEQRRMLSLLATAGRDGATQEQLNAPGFEPQMFAELVNQGLVTRRRSAALRPCQARRFALLGRLPAASCYRPGAQKKARARGRGQDIQRRELP
jgi:hypothetical protein